MIIFKFSEPFLSFYFLYNLRIFIASLFPNLQSCPPALTRPTRLGSDRSAVSSLAAPVTKPTKPAFAELAPQTKGREPSFPKSPAMGP